MGEGPDPSTYFTQWIQTLQTAPNPQHPRPSVHFLLVPEQLGDLDEPFPQPEPQSKYPCYSPVGRQSWDQVFLTNFQTSRALTRMLRDQSYPLDFSRRSSSCSVSFLQPAGPSKLSFLVPSNRAMLALRHYCIRGWRERSAVKSTSCTCRGPGFDS